MKILFYGYRSWSIKIYQKLIKNCDYDIVLCSYKKIDETFINNFNPDIILFYGWSWLIPNNIIDRYLCVCLHPSKLPKFRGGSPIQNQILNGNLDSAVTLFKMTDKIDAGPILYQKDMKLNGNIKKIFKKITNIGYELTFNLIKDFVEKKLTFTEQKEEDMSYYRRRNQSQSEIKAEDFKEYEAQYLFDLVRCLQKPYPLPYIRCKNNTKLYLLKTKIDRDEKRFSE